LGGVVQFIFFNEDPEGVFRPANLTLQYGRNEDRWHPIKTSHFLSAGRTGAIGDPSFIWLQPLSVIETSCGYLEDDPEPGQLAVVMSGFHAPEVAEIWLVQGGGIDNRPA
jgi:hypothetical protein